MPFFYGFKLSFFPILIAWIIFSGSSSAYAQKIDHFKVAYPHYIIGDQFAEVKLEALTPTGRTDSSISGKMEISINKEVKVIDFIDGVSFFTIEVKHTQTYQIIIADEEKTFQFTIRYLPPWISIFPPLIAIILAIITKEVLISLFISIFIGVLTLKGFELANILPSLFTVVDTYILETLKDTRHLSVVLFSLLIGGMVSLISQNGGMKGVANKLSKYAHSPRSAQLMTFFLSLGIFYDNYTNILIAGNTMRPVTDKFKVSREKLAFIVHGTGASITAIAFISTWIGAELGYINDATSHLGLPDKTYVLFFKSLQFAFYPIFMLSIIFFTIFLKKDFGPMNVAEVEARNADVIKANQDLEKEENEEIEEDLKRFEPEITDNYKYINALLPILAFIAAAFIGLLITGAYNAYDNLLSIHHKHDYSFGYTWQNLHLLQPQNKNSFFAKLGILITYSDFYIPLLWSSFTGVTVAALLTVLKRKVTLRFTMESLLNGFRVMLPAVIILVFAWALAQIIEDLHTTDYVASLISTKLIFPKILPVFVFLLSAFFSFATGSVWGTLAILYPLIVPVAWSLSLHTGLSIPDSERILYMTISAIITGSVFGNHCSPISDTTTVSAISSDCDLVAHIKTQVPYALLAAGLTIFLLCVSLIGLHWTWNYLLGILLIFVIIKYKGKVLD